MLKAYQEGKDLYATIASMSFDKPYEDCLEFYPEGTEIEFEGEKVVCGYKTHLNVKGKERRSQAKSILLGLLYGRSAASIAEQIQKTKEEAQGIIDKFFKAFPKVKNWIDETKANAHKNGYVEDWYGRRRHLPEIQLPKYEIKASSAAADNNFNPILGCPNRLDDKLLNKYSKLLEKVYSRKEYEDIQKRALLEGVEIHSNTMKIAEAERQSVNSRVQGGAASLTKLAMINIHKNKRLQELGFKLLITVHDEVIGECPKEHADEVEKLLPQIMIDTAKPFLNVPMACDPVVEPHWYFSELAASIQKDIKKIHEECPEKDLDSIHKQILESHTELSEEMFESLLNY